jgi:hypothetical protein
MVMGPLEYVIIQFPGHEFSGEIMPELRAIVEKGLIHIVDLTFIMKDEAGKVQAYELADVTKDVKDAWKPVVAEVRGLLSKSDIDEAGSLMEENTSAALMLFEHLWAIDFKLALQRAGGRLLAQERVAQEDLEAALAEIEMLNERSA